MNIAWEDQSEQQCFICHIELPVSNSSILTSEIDKTVLYV